MTTRTDILKLSYPELEEALLSLGEKKFRAKQVWQWLWAKNARSFEAMTNLSKALRAKLETNFDLHKIAIDTALESKDGSVKYTFRLHDGHLVEGVLIPTAERATACVSSQVGCSLNCKFCATGYLDLKRNLTHYEIYDQVYTITQESERRLGRPLSNVVYMGMGEPLLNYRNVLGSIERVNAEDGLHMSPRRITVSTVGIAKLIKRLGDDAVKFELALSLHAANDEKRSTIMPINDTNSLEALGEALRYFYDKTGTRITLEYIVFDHINDNLSDAQELSDFARRVPTKINIIEYNPIAEAEFRMTSEARLNTFIAYLEDRGHIVNVRRSRGKDVDGGCGQLALKQLDNAAKAIP
ncbi:MAG: 23S rRNA (adenine(2503)-C(2))-methyltransferase RlmN [Bacteroidota bacterium]